MQGLCKGAALALVLGCAGVVSAQAEESPFPPFAEVVEGLEVHEGLMTLYRGEADPFAGQAEQLLCEIPQDLLDTDLLFATSISRGGFFTGWMWSDALVRWQLRGTQVVLSVPETRYVQEEGAPVTDAVRRTYNAQYLTTAEVVTFSDAGNPVIDLGPLLKSDIADVSWMGEFSGVGSMLREDLSRFTEAKAFPDNVLVDVDLALEGVNGGGSVGVSYAFRRLPELGEYTPREADDRVGYFLTAQLDWSRPAGERELFRRLVQRWHLVKQDPSLEYSPPVEPIVFIVEKTVPIRWRRYVRQGILAWNEAFEELGFTDAVVVRQQTETNEYADYDPEDARHNFFRWIVSGSAFAMGPSRVDPRTGQILDADIIMDDSMLRYFTQDFDVYGPTSLGQDKRAIMADWLDAHEHLDAERLPVRLREELSRPERLVREAARRRGWSRHHDCGFADGLKRELTLAHLAHVATASGKELPERLLGEVIREVVMHEVGHTLGLRHNFKASSWLSLDEVRERRDTDEPSVASVMDYNPLLFFAGESFEDVRHFTTPCIGPYDEWAIAYGYSDGEQDEGLLARSGERELAFATDEDTLWVISPDPLVNRFDMGSSPVDWARTRLALCDSLLEDLRGWSVNEGDPRYVLRQAFEALFFTRALTNDLVVRLVGGQEFHRDHVGSDRPAFEPISAAQQREALAYLCDGVWSADFFAMDPELLNELAPSRWSHWGAFPSDRLDVPVHEMIGMAQWWCMVDLLSPPLLQRVYDTELKTTEDDPFTAAELIVTLRDRIWSGLGRFDPDAAYTTAEPLLSSIERSCQREYLEYMLMLAQVPPGYVMSADLTAMLRHSLRELLPMLRTLESAAGLDFASQAHAAECASRIQRALDAPFHGE